MIKKILVLLLLSFYVVGADGGSMEFGEPLGYDNDYLGFTGDTGELESLYLYSSDSRVISIGGDGGDLKIGDNEFKNIVPRDDGKSTFTLDAKGDLVEADFKVGDTGIYSIGGTEFQAPPGSNVKFKDGIITLNPPKDSRIEFPQSLDASSADVKIIGENIKLPGEHILNSGEILVRGFNNYQVSDARIDGVDIIGEKVPVYFDGKIHDYVTSYVSFGEDTVFANIVQDDGGYNLDFNKDSIMKGETDFYFKDKGSYSMMFDGNTNVAGLQVRTKSSEELFNFENGYDRFIVKGDGTVLKSGFGLTNNPSDFTLSSNILDDDLSFTKEGFIIGAMEEVPLNTDALEREHNVKIKGHVKSDALMDLERIIREINPKGVIDEVQVSSNSPCGDSCLKDRVAYVNPEDIKTRNNEEFDGLINQFFE